MTDNHSYLIRLMRTAGNLYGELDLEELWELNKILRDMKLTRETVSKKDLIAFTDEGVKDAKLPFLIKDEKDLFEDGSTDPIHRHILNRKLMDPGDGTIETFYTIYDLRHCFTPYVDRDFWSYRDDTLSLSELCLREFLDKISCGPLTWDQNGNPLSNPYRGRKLKEIRGLSQAEKEQAETYPNSAQQRRYQASLTGTASQRILNSFRLNCQAGDVPMGMIMMVTLDDIHAFGGNIRKKDEETFSSLLFQAWLDTPCWGLAGHSMRHILMDFMIQDDPRAAAMDDPRAAVQLSADMLAYWDGNPDNIPDPTDGFLSEEIFGSEDDSKKEDSGEDGDKPKDTLLS
jgi:hypothetical protein